ncbi:MAG: LCCL domain-containing protein, partial [Pseudomonadota bacterium]
MKADKPLKNLFTLLFATLLAQTATAQTATDNSAPVPEIDWETSINHFQFDSDKFVGQRLSVVCPPLTARDTMPDIHGTDVYPSNSPVCAAARHAGRIDAGGGSVTVQLNPGADEYPGSTRNGVTSASLPATNAILRFVA